MLQLSPSALGSDVTAAIVKRATEYSNVAGSSAESTLGSHGGTFQSGLELSYETALRYQPRVSCVIPFTEPEGFTLSCLIKFSIASQTSLWKVSSCKSRQRNT